MPRSRVPKPVARWRRCASVEEGADMTSISIAQPTAAPAGLRRDLQAIQVVWKRDVMSFWRNKTRMIVTFVQPLLFLFVLGTGLSSLTAGSTGDLDFRAFVFPGVIAMTALMPSFFAAGSIVYDREYGFLREMLVAPVRRSTIVIGKALG